MSAVIQAYPLQWPVGWKRVVDRKDAQFKSGGKALTIAEGTVRVLTELERLGVVRDDCVISTNVGLRMDGLPRSDQAAPVDPGVAVYWRTAAGNRVMAVDRYWKVADNLAAIAATLDAMRAIDRHGGAVVLERAFTGFTALPAPERPWREVLGIQAGSMPSEGTLRMRYKVCRSDTHPDKGGAAADFDAVNKAYATACDELGFTT